MFSLTTLAAHKRFNIDSIAEAFSVGEFEHVFDELDENIVWIILGEAEFKGKKDVVNHCEQVKNYFNSITTNFEIQDTISDYNKIVVMGTAQFIRDSELISSVSACDIYEFNNQHQIIKITSYCIKH
ncbi:MAG: nuclear transport factor 2 family protein [Flavobacteriaceae bacterium]